MPIEPGLEEEIRLRELDTLTALNWAKEGRIEDWVHKYLLSGSGGPTNSIFSEGLKREKRWWNGPLYLSLSDLSPVVGPDPGLEYTVDGVYWQERTGGLAQTFSDPQALPPLIAEYRSGQLSVRDGNTRYGAMKLLGWSACWVVIWYNSESDYHTHSEVLFGSKAG